MTVGMDMLLADYMRLAPFVNAGTTPVQGKPKCGYPECRLIAGAAVPSPGESACQDESFHVISILFTILIDDANAVST
ncbi:hypothetical protein DSCO28_62280 [Desulfosarcina ovata subsp. sediminis]|uniref:Uncharacterized protein n=1 Tax=Desulfosarcina ovata subsp. sediminis TaxID=885957 RepID=A0A5K7ZZI4_9BACT|nr:hypothetical protein DSCO28_62280 [Desulfosarcina ovata subsp. sediminis]